MSANEEPNSEPWNGLREVVKLLLMGIAEHDWNEAEMRARELLVLLAGAPELLRQKAIRRDNGRSTPPPAESDPK